MFQVYVGRGDGAVLSPEVAAAAMVLKEEEVASLPVQRLWLACVRQPLIR